MPTCKLASCVRQPTSSLTWNHFSLRATTWYVVRSFVSLTAGGSHNRTSRLHPPRYFFSYSDSSLLSSGEREPAREPALRTSKVEASSVRGTLNVLNSHMAILPGDSHTETRTPLFPRLLHYVSGIIKITSNLSRQSESLSTRRDADLHFQRP